MSKSKRVQVSVDGDKKDKIDAELHNLTLDFGWFVRACVNKALNEGLDFLLDKRKASNISDIKDLVKKIPEPAQTSAEIQVVAKNVPTQEGPEDPVDQRFMKEAKTAYPHLYLPGPDSVGRHLMAHGAYTLVEAKYNGVKQKGRFDTVWHETARKNGKTFPMVRPGRMDEVYQNDGDYTSMRTSDQAVWVVSGHGNEPIIEWRQPTQDEWYDGDCYNGRHTIVVVVDRIMDSEQIDNIFQHRIWV